MYSIFIHLTPFFPSPLLRRGLGRGHSKIFLKTSSGTSLVVGFLGIGTSSFFASVFSEIKFFNLFISSALAARALDGTVLFKSSLKAKFSPPAGRAGFVKIFLMAPKTLGFAGAKDLLIGREGLRISGEDLPDG